ncbi:MAG: PEGA domain-containing protein [Limisphaerales bacterium]
MKLNRWLGALLILLVASAVQVPGQTTEAERKQFTAVKARADKGDADAQLSVASLYANGTGVARDPVKAAKYIRKAAEQGLARAQCLLGLAYSNGDGVKLDKAEAARWLRRAADQGLAEAQFDLGMCYANGDGVAKNPVEAVEWYRKAAAQDLVDAEGEIGNCYLEGNGVPTDIPEGVKWTRQAAERGFAPAQNTLGLCYSKGKGVAKDYVEAYKWFNLAAAKGGDTADDARINLAAAERYLNPEQVAEAQRLAREFKPRKASSPGESPNPPNKATFGPAGGGTRPTGSVWGASAKVLKTGLVSVKAEDDSYEIFVDGAFVGNTPANVKLMEGAHVVEVKKPGFKDYRKEIKISDGSELTLRAVLEKQ